MLPSMSRHCLIHCPIGRVHSRKIVDTIEVEANVLINYGSQGEILGIEIIDASKLTKANPLHEIVIKIQDKAEA